MVGDVRDNAGDCDDSKAVEEDWMETLETMLAMIARLRMRKKEKFPNRWMVGDECPEFLLLLSSRSRSRLKYNGMADGQAYGTKLELELSGTCT